MEANPSRLHSIAYILPYPPDKTGILIPPVCNSTSCSQVTGMVSQQRSSKNWRRVCGGWCAFSVCEISGAGGFSQLLRRMAVPHQCGTNMGSMPHPEVWSSTISCALASRDGTNIRLVTCCWLRSSCSATKRSNASWYSFNLRLIPLVGLAGAEQSSGSPQVAEGVLGPTSLGTRLLRSDDGECERYDGSGVY